MKVPREWNQEVYQKFQQELKLLEDETYKEFNFKLIFTDYEKIGIRLPILRSIAKKIMKGDYICFLEQVEDTYYEEVMLEGLVIASIKDIDQTLYYFNRYLKKIDNWALCDSVVASMKIVKDYKNIFYKQIKKYIKSKEEYTMRVGFVLLLNYYIEDFYIDKIFKLCDSVKVDLYYVNMAISWLISECFIDYKEETIEFLRCNNLNKFTQNKAISKIKDSYRVSASDKILLNDFRR